ncbi:MAG: hypothetical protein JNJ94_11955 [Chlorobi bacterium]|nr:hypothetical protein [Chlorobiota bacterium]
MNVSNGPITISPPYKADTTTQATVKFLMTESVTLQPQEKHQLSVEITPKASGLYRVEVTVPTSGSYSQKVIIPAFFISRENTVAAKENGEVRRE